MTSQRMLTVVSSKNGSMTAVLGSSARIMSDSLMPFQPAIDEPSNILPSRNKSSSTAFAGIVTCCSLPRVSVKRRSAYLTSLSLINLITSAGFIFLNPLKEGFKPRSQCIDCASHGSFEDQWLRLTCTVYVHDVGATAADFAPTWNRFGRPFGP